MSKVVKVSQGPTGKRERALARLIAGQRLFRLPNGQWKFGGNKFVPNSCLRGLPLVEAYENNRGWIAHELDERFAEKLRRG